MIPTPSTPCPICNRLPKLHKMQTPERGEEWSATCVGPKHAVSIHRQETPESAVEEWDKRLGGMRP